MLQIACAIIQKTPVIIFDEPASGLDPELTAKFWLLMDQLAEEGRGMIIMANQMVKEVSGAQIFILSVNGLTAMNSSNTSSANSFENEFKGVS